MIQLEDCFENQVGITKNECNCYPHSEATGSINITNSESGYFFEDFLDISMVDFSRCGEGEISVLNKIDDALKWTWKEIAKDVGKDLIEKGYKPRAAFRGPVGQSAYRGVRNDSSPNRGITIRPMNLPGGIIRVKGVHLIFDDEYIFDLNFVDGNTGAVVTKSVTSEANKWKYVKFEESYDFDMEDFSADEVHGFAVYHTQSGYMDNKVDCSCGKPPAWKKHFNARGFVSNATDIDSLMDAGKSVYGHGIKLEIEILCQIEHQLCQLRNTHSDTIAEARCLRAAMKILNDMLVTKEVNTFNVYDREGAAALIQDYNEKYWENIRYISQSAAATKCFYCDPNIRKRPILA